MVLYQWVAMDELAKPRTNPDNQSGKSNQEEEEKPNE